MVSPFFPQGWHARWNLWPYGVPNDLQPGDDQGSTMGNPSSLGILGGLAAPNELDGNASNAFASPFGSSVSLFGISGAQDFPQGPTVRPPLPQSLANMGGTLASLSAFSPDGTAEPASPVQSDFAQQARDVAAERLGKRYQTAARRQSMPAEPAAEAEAAEPGFRERMRLNFLDAYYRGTLAGAGRLAWMAHLAATPDSPEIDPARKRVHDDLRREYREIVADLANYDRMRSFGNSREFAATALGQVGGGMLSPESWIGLGAKGTSAARRIVRGGVEQGAMNAVTDPVVQELNIAAGVQDKQDPVRTTAAALSGAAFGSGAKSVNEALGQIGTRRGLSPKNKFDAPIYDWQRRTLENFAYDHPEARPAAISSWRPNKHDINPITTSIIEFLDAKGKKGFEKHHSFPEQLVQYFERAGINIEDYLMHMWVSEHRLKPNGLHTGSNHWNKEWKNFSAQHPNATQDQVYEQGYKMLEDRGLLNRSAQEHLKDPPDWWTRFRRLF